jgi:putative aldouronate transport system permease protein
MLAEVDQPATTTARNQRPAWSRQFQRTAVDIWRHRWLYVLLLPGLLFFIVFVYVPLAGSVVAFQDYSPFRGFSGSEWVGLDNFRKLFTDRDLPRVTINTLVLSSIQIVIAFPIPIILALMLNELRGTVFKRTIQSILYLPHFISWVIIVGIWYQLFGSRGLVNQMLQQFDVGSIGFLTDPGWFRVMFVMQGIWKDSGWGTIIFLAALAGVDNDLYEAAALDGASRWQRLIGVTLPSIMPIVLLVLILRLGNVLDTGFEHIFLLLNSGTEPVAQVLDTFVYTKGIVRGDISFATAVGLVKGLVGLVLVVGANRLTKRFGQEGVY